MKNNTIIGLYVAFIISFLLFCLFFPEDGFSDEKNFSVTPIAGVYMPTGSEGVFQDGIKYGIQARYKNAAVRFERIEAGTRDVGQGGIDLNFNMLLAGFIHDCKPSDFGFLSIGFFGGVAIPDYDDSWHYDGPYKEGLDRTSKKMADVNTATYSTGANQFDKGRATYDPTGVLEFMMSYTMPVKHGAFFFSGEYTYLSVTRDIVLIDEPNINGGWDIEYKLDCSGYSIMFGWTMSF